MIKLWTKRAGFKLARTKDTAAWLGDDITTHIDGLRPSDDETAVIGLGLSREALREENADLRVRAELAEAERDGLADALRIAERELAERDDLDAWSLPDLGSRLAAARLAWDEPIPDDAYMRTDPDGADRFDGTWPPVFGDAGAHHDRDVAALVVDELGQLLDGPLAGTNGTAAGEEQ